MSVPAALHGWHARPGTSSSLPTTAEQALSQCWQRIDQLPCVPESRTALFVVPSGSSPVCTSLTATRNARAALLGLTAPKQPQLPCDARELAQRYVRMPMRTPRAYCSLRAVAPRCPLFAGAVRRHRELELDSAAATPQHSTAATPRLTAATARRHQQQS